MYVISTEAEKSQNYFVISTEAKIKNTPDKRGTEYGKIKNEI